MDYTWHLIWHSRYGKEEIDSTDSAQEAIYLKKEYSLAFGEGYIEIERRRA